MLDLVSESEHLNPKHGSNWLSIFLTILVIVCGNVAGASWYASAQASTVSGLSEKYNIQEAHLKILDDKYSDIEKALAVLQDRSDENLRTTQRVEFYINPHSRK